MEIKNIPKWAIIFTWILLIGLAILIAWLLIFMTSEVETLKLIGSACDICEQSRYGNNFILNISNP